MSPKKTCYTILAGLTLTATMTLLMLVESEVHAGIESMPGNGDAAELEGLGFTSKVFASGPVTLRRGEYREPAAPGSASEIIIHLGDKRAFGELQGAQAGAAIVTTSMGGSGTFYERACCPKRRKDG